MATKKRNKSSLTAMRYNAGDMIWYRKQMMVLIREMNKEVRDSIVEIALDNPLAQDMSYDANPVDFFKSALRRLSSKWIDRFISMALPNATAMTDRAGGSVDKQASAEFRKMGMTINMQWTDAMLQKKDAIIAENVSLIRSIPEKYFTEVEGMVYRSIAAGGDRKALADEIYSNFSKREGITRRRANNIARDQVRKSTAALFVARQQAAGITEGEWIHSGGGNEPRKKHVHANGKRFKLSEGLSVGDNNEYVMPGQQINCGCTFKPILPW